MIQYTWNISYMNTKPSEDGLTNVVVSCQWTIVGTDGQFKSSNYGYTNFSPPQPNDFTAYSELTKEQVLNWVWSAPSENGGVDKNVIEEGIAAQIEQQKNPPTVVLSNPWSDVTISTQ